MPSTAAGVLLFGGSFDPPHRGHIDLPRRLRDRVLGRGWRLVYVPAARSPLKSKGPFASERHRIAMLRLATEKTRNSIIWTDEIDRARRRPGPSYWIDTLRRARSILPPEVSLRFVIGSDQAAAFHLWKQYREILELAQPLVMVRAPHASRAAVLRALKETRAWSEGDLKRWRTWIDLDTPKHELGLSSTAVRYMVWREHAAQKRVDAGSVAPWLTASVRAYIRKHRLYTKA